MCVLDDDGHLEKRVRTLVHGETKMRRVRTFVGTIDADVVVVNVPSQTSTKRIE